MTGLLLVSYIALWSVVLAVVVLLVGMLRHIGILYQQSDRLSGPPTTLRAGNSLPSVTLSTITGGSLAISQLAGASANIIVVTPQCSGCHTLLKQIAQGGGVGQDSDQQIIISMGDLTATTEMLRTAGLATDDSILVDSEESLRRVWGVHTTPVTVVVDKDLRVRRQIVGTTITRPTSPLGQVANTTATG